MKKIAFFILIIFSTELYAQDEAENEFLVSYFKDRKERVSYAGKIYDYTINQIKTSLQSTDTLYEDNFPYQIANPGLKDKIIFTKKELQEVFDIIESSNNETWVKNKLPNSNYIEPDKIKYEDYIYYLSKPIMLRKNEICIFYFGNTESGKLSVYKKQNGEWKYFAYIFLWVS